MEFYPAWPPVAIAAILLALLRLPPFRSADAPPSARRPAIDGLRGLLALGVVLHHGAIYHRYLVDGIWILPPSAPYVLLGQGSVSLFFMITAFLFWGRVIDEGGRPDWARLLVGRLFRIGPTYLLAVAGLLVLVAARTGWRLHVPAAELAAQVAPWLALGLADPHDVNGLAHTWILVAGVTWSLRVEWLFYLALPVLAVAVRPGRVRGGIMLAAIAGALAWAVGRGPGTSGALAAPFLAGMGYAALERLGWGPRLGDRVGSAALALVLLVLFRTCRTSDTPLAVILLGLCLALVASGCTLFGLLTHRGTRRLGDISFGIYLLQGLVLSVVFGWPPVRAFALPSSWRHWTVVLAAAVILVVLATAAHRWVERPGIALGRLVARPRPAVRVREQA